MSLSQYRIAFFCYCAFIGAFSTQWAIYLKQHLGFGDGTIGVLNGLFLLSILVANFVVSRIADARRNRLALQRIMSALGCGVCFLWPLATEAWQVALMLLLQGWTCHVQVSMLDASIVDRLGKNRARYGTVRAFGTIGYGVAVFAVSRMRNGDPAQFFTLVQAALIAFHLSTWLLPRSQVAPAEQRPHLALSTVFSNRPLLVLLGTTFTYSCSFACYEVFGSLYFTEAGLSEHAIGNLYVASSLAEILVFFLTPLFLRRWHARHIIAFSMLVCAARWAVMSQTSDHDTLMLLQISHALCFGLWWGATIHIMGRLVDAEVRTSGQALLAMSFSAGFGVGGTLCGLVRASAGGAVALQASAVLAALSGLVVLCMQRVFDDTRLAGDPRHVGVT